MSKSPETSSLRVAGTGPDLVSAEERSARTIAYVCTRFDIGEAKVGAMFKDTGVGEITKFV